MADAGRALIIAGAVIAVIGVVLVGSSRLQLPLGRLPGDIVYRGKHTTFYFPLVTCIVVSVVLSLIVWVAGHLHR